jgi:hypothetical protein
MIPEIRTYAPELAAELAALDPDGDGEVKLSFKVLPKAPNHLCADEIAILVGRHEYHLHQTVDRVYIFGARDSLRALAVLIASCALRREPTEVRIDLTQLSDEPRASLGTNVSRPLGFPHSHPWRR